MTKRPDLSNTKWDYCIIGSGVSAMWASHYFWSKKNSVLWITTEGSGTPAKASLSHSWTWGISETDAKWLCDQLPGFSAELSPYQVVYYDAKSTKRFKAFKDAKKDWGTHEKSFFELIAKENLPNEVDLWAWQEKASRFYQSREESFLAVEELFSDPRFVRVQGFPILELQVSDHHLAGVVLGLADERKTEEVTVSAEKFIIGDFEEPLGLKVTDQKLGESLTSALKGRTFLPGFGVRFEHESFSPNFDQTCVIPLYVSPDKGEASHVMGRFIWQKNKLHSVWSGFLTSEELEDNNEILKKIKLTRRAVERAFPGFSESIVKESVTFEPKMRAERITKNKVTESLGAHLISDQFGLKDLTESVQSIFSESIKELNEESQEHEVESSHGSIST